jgi:hypothetical protein
MSSFLPSLALTQSARQDFMELPYGSFAVLEYPFCEYPFCVLRKCRQHFENLSIHRNNPPLVVFSFTSIEADRRAFKST